MRLRRLWWLVVGCAVGLAVRCPAQQPNLIVDVQLAGTNEHTVVEAMLTHDSTLLLPAADIAAFLGTGPPTTAWITPADLQHAYPTVTVTFELRALVLVIDDRQRVLPVSRRLYGGL